ncbi:MAG: T9SS type A sorting domain-containing protein [Bacteroidales bacterium]|nr:T9SS type A sorting domain-containing protein [Bacteroidales bacterium]MCF8343633.1 T9SS type A sorting domain-containing protein [Bacteroidales bacterium]MCF8350119.1 T9SS type A sorting domain-containing protein [Bacteroidales bacterium]MCF8376177.1 T9SS type A sorting domain-containing protein [Bacteroidales bacterium]MCF8401157.1 T9SS type A sorting domain-containing protein [Bacteroidales bacterium]
MKTKNILIPVTVAAMLLAAALFTFDISTEKTDRQQYAEFILEEAKNVPDMSSEELESMPGPTRPDLAAWQDYFATLDPALGRVPVERLKVAIEQSRQDHFGKQFKSINALTWESTGAVMGGRTRAVMFDPNDPDQSKVWAGGVTGGLWYNDDITDESSAWMAVNDFWSSLSISCITHDPNSPNVFYVGTGEVQTAFTTYRESSGVGVGIYKSANGGEYWQLLPSTEDFKYITDIVVRDENGTSVIYAGVASGSYHGQVHQSEPTDGLYRSTNGGSTWEQVLPDMEGLDIPWAVSDIALGADGRIYVGTIQNINVDGGATILYSDQGTSGNWTVYDDYVNIIENNSEFYVPGRVIMAPAPSDENIVYALLAAGYTNSAGFNYYHGRYILKSTDKGESWMEIPIPTSGGNSYANLAWHAMTGAVNPQNPDILYVGGLDVWNTFDSGEDWNHVSDWALMYWGGGDEYVHADQHAQVYRPGHNNEMVFGSDGGIFYTATAGQEQPIFMERNNNFNTLQFYTCDLSPVPGLARYIGGLQDNGTLYYKGSPLAITDMVSGGDGAYCFWDKDQSNVFITSIYYNSYYLFVNNNQVDNFGSSSGIFINPADYDYKENTLYANAVTFSGQYHNHILRVTDVTGFEITELINAETGVLTWFSHVKYSPYSPEGTATLFLGTTEGRLFKVENAQDNPVTTEIGSTDFPLGNISCVAIGGSEDTLLVSFSNYGVSSVWQTFDGGDSWQEKEGNLPDMPIRWAIYHPENTEQALLATECGIWSTNELHQPITNWETDIEGLANVRIDMIKLREADNTVLAATHGRGLFTTNYELNPWVGVEEISEKPQITVYPNPSSGIFNIETTGMENASIQIYDLQGRLILEDEIIKGFSSKQYDLSDERKSTYMITLTRNGKTSTQKILIN